MLMFLIYLTYVCTCNHTHTYVHTLPFWLPPCNNVIYNTNKCPCTINFLHSWFEQGLLNSRSLLICQCVNLFLALVLPVVFVFIMRCGPGQLAGELSVIASEPPHLKLYLLHSSGIIRDSVVLHLHLDEAGFLCPGQLVVQKSIPDEEERLLAFWSLLDKLKLMFPAEASDKRKTSKLVEYPDNLNLKG